jgi:hypothetical protein
MVYNLNTKEITVVPLKSFVIDHPLDQSKYLVHVCLEGPEAGVYYRGDGEITDNKSTVITLPDYVSALATDFSIQITPIHDETDKVYNLSTSRVKDNKFTVYSPINCEFFWTVYGKRCEINTEPRKSDVVVKGNGPYKWL